MTRRGATYMLDAASTRSMRARFPAALGAALAILGALMAIVALAPHLLGDCVVWCFFGSGAGGVLAGAVGAAACLGGTILFTRTSGAP